MNFLEPIDAESLVGLEGDVAALMGFTGFSTTKNTKVGISKTSILFKENYKNLEKFRSFSKSLNFQVAGNADGAVKINKQRKYRQYMNRKGGFNRPLDYIA